jgi:hypothetical protein
MSDELKIGDLVALRNWDWYSDPKIRLRGERQVVGDVVNELIASYGQVRVVFPKTGRMQEFGKWLYVRDLTRIAPPPPAEPRGIFTKLTPDQQRAALAYRGDENHGDADFLRAQLVAGNRIARDAVRRHGAKPRIAPPEGEA